jgi:peptidylprolyl isomerase
MKLSLVVALALLAVLFGAGCASEDETTSVEDTAKPADAPRSRPPGAPARADADEWRALRRLAGRWSKRLLVPKGPSPDHVLIRDLRPGSGPTLKPDDSFEANYVSFYYSDGSVREDHWHLPPELLYWNMERIVDAWIPGLKGMRAGGIRELVAPSSWAYENGPVVYLVKVTEIKPD